MTNVNDVASLDAMLTDTPPIGDHPDGFPGQGEYVPDPTAVPAVTFTPRPGEVLSITGNARVDSVPPPVNPGEGTNRLQVGGNVVTPVTASATAPKPAFSITDQINVYRDAVLSDVRDRLEGIPLTDQEWGIVSRATETLTATVVLGMWQTDPLGFAKITFKRDAALATLNGITVAKRLTVQTAVLSSLQSVLTNALMFAGSVLANVIAPGSGSLVNALRQSIAH